MQTRQWRRSAALAAVFWFALAAGEPTLRAASLLPDGAVQPSIQATAPQAACENAIRKAAGRHKVPLQILRAVAMVESGRTVDGRAGPWPWTINAEGRGHFFASRSEARAFARAAERRGVTSMDLGCLQLNTRWHGHRFASLDAMLDPARNADYAARFLADLRREAGSWIVAAGHYHSRTQALAAPYRGKVERVLAGLTPSAGQVEGLAAHRPGRAGDARVARGGLPLAFAASPRTRLVSVVHGNLFATATGPLVARRDGGTATAPAPGSLFARKGTD